MAAYVNADGSESSSRDAAAIGIDEGELVQVVRRYNRRMPVGFYVGSAMRESGVIQRSGLKLYVTNEHDTDYKDDGSQYDSYGLFQLSKKEVGRSLNLPTLFNMIDPETQCEAFTVVMEAHLDKILGAASLDSPTYDTWCYLAWAHNAGVGQPVKSIGSYGLDWEALKVRNARENPAGYVTKKLVPYAEYIRKEIDRLADADIQVAGAEVDKDNSYDIKKVLLIVAATAGAMLLV